MTSPRSIALTECALRILSRPARGAWTVVLARDAETVAGALADELRSLDDRVPRVVPWTTLTGLVRVLRHPNDDAVIVTGLEAATAEDWSELDLARSEFQRAGEVVIVVTRDAADQLARSAPHLLSWIGGDVWRIDLDAERETDAAAVEGRLAALRHEHRMTDEEVVGKAIEGTLPLEPEFAEWLALLGRGDLLVPR